MITIHQFNQAITIVRRAEEDIRNVTGMDMGLQIIALSLHRLTPEVIARLAAEEAGISYEELIGPARNVRLLRPRYAAMMHTRTQLPALSLSQIGAVYGRDHSTVINSIRSGEDMLATDGVFKTLFNAIYYRIQKFQELPTESR